MRRKLIKSLSYVLTVNGSLLGIACSCGLLAATQFLLLDSEKRELEAQTNSAFDYASAVSVNMKKSLTEASQLTFPRCSDEDLEALRSALWQNDFVKDLGRVVDGNILCTAGWGVLKQPVALPQPPSFTNKGYSHWSGVNGLIAANVAGEMSVYQDTISFTSPFAFQRLRVPNSYTGFLITGADINNVYRIVGDIPDNARIEKDLDGSFSLTTNILSISRCSNDPALCVTGVKSHVGLANYSWPFIAAIAASGIFLGAGLYLLAFFMFSGKWVIYRRLRKAVRRKTLFMVYQPQYELRTGKLVGVEALVRWHDVRLGFVPPDVFIPIAEEIGLIQELTEVVVETSFSEMKELLTHYADLGLSINLSMENLVSPLFLGFINDLSKRYELNPNQLTFEVTERSAAGDDKMAESARQFAAHSYKISLDDFGTGYSNLSWLSQLDADEIKVDRVFTQAIGTSSINQNMLTAIFQLVHTLGVQLVFEGIESQHEVDYILRHSTDAIGQGWLFSKPVSVEVLKAVIEKNRATQDAS